MVRISRCFMVIFILVASVSVMGAQETNNEANWPSFRGINARGFSDGRPTPAIWNVENGDNIEWKTPVPGLAHSSPIIWENRIFITTAISETENPELKTGLYGNINPVEDETVHLWKVYCLDKKTGKVLWEKTPKIYIFQIYIKLLGRIAYEE